MEYQVRCMNINVLIVQIFLYVQWIGFFLFVVFLELVVLCDFVDVDFRVKVSGKGLVVIVVVIVDNIQIVDFVEVVFCCISGVNVGYVWIEIIVKQCYDIGIFKFILIGLLLVVFKFGNIFRFIVGGIEVISFGGQIGIYDGQILIWQCQVNYQIRVNIVNQCFNGFSVVSINSENVFYMVDIYFLLKCFIFGNSVVGQVNFVEVFRQVSIFFYGNCCYVISVDDQNMRYSFYFFCNGFKICVECYQMV